jgi:hypothetical protein
MSLYDTEARCICKVPFAPLAPAEWTRGLVSSAALYDRRSAGGYMIVSRTPFRVTLGVGEPTCRVSMRSTADMCWRSGSTSTCTSP